ncbi:MAG: H-NS histone family protein [Bacteroidetes bacterium]|nr:H-NS histone family protein [Bacteroidota bacterium]
MATYSELLKQREELEKQIEAAREQELSGAKAKIIELMDMYGLTCEDLVEGRGRAPHQAKIHVKPKYRNPETGQTWSGRGKPPAWIANKDRAQFAIQDGQ